MKHGFPHSGTLPLQGARRAAYAVRRGAGVRAEERETTCVEVPGRRAP